MSTTFICTIISCILIQNTMGILIDTKKATCTDVPLNITDFEAKFYQSTIMDTSILGTVASQLTINGVVAQILLILSSCPDFCLTRYAADAGPPINKAIQEAADDAARLAAGHAASNVKNSTYKYDYIRLLLSCQPGINVYMTNCANKAREAATTHAVAALKKECPKLNTDAIEQALSTLLSNAFSPLISVAIAETAKNLLLALPCGSWKIVPGVDMPPLPGFTIPKNLLDNTGDILGG